MMRLRTAEEEEDRRAIIKELLKREGKARMKEGKKETATMGNKIIWRNLAEILKGQGGNFRERN